MSKTPTEFLDNVLALISTDSLRQAAEEAPDAPGANLSLASMLITRVLSELSGKAEAIGCLEMIKFKMQIENLPEQWWPKPDIQKGDG